MRGGVDHVSIPQKINFNIFFKIKIDFCMILNHTSLYSPDDAFNWVNYIEGFSYSLPPL